jgi:hypothetical protein
MQLYTGYTVFFSYSESVSRENFHQMRMKKNDDGELSRELFNQANFEEEK